MNGWTWLRSLFWLAKPKPLPTVPRRVTQASRLQPLPPPDPVESSHLFFLPWLTASGQQPLATGDMTAPEQAVLDELHKLLVLKALPDALLPRMADVLPQLIALTRDNNLPAKAIARRVEKDALLTAEVLRLASSSYYNLDRPLSNIVQAIQLIGSAGLQTAMARIVLKPIYRDGSGLVNANLVTRLAEHADALADVCANAAEQAGMSRFDGYLAGMLHDTGWRVALRAIERSKMPLDLAVSEQFAIEITDIAHRLFGLAARRWPITPGFTAFAQDAASHGLAGGQHPLASILRNALQQALPPQQVVVEDGKLQK